MAKRSTGKRDLVRGRNAKLYSKRDERGRFVEMAEVGRSQAADRRRSAKKTVKPGYGDQGDRKRR